MATGSANALTIENVLQNSEPVDGVEVRREIDLLAWASATGIPLAASTTGTVGTLAIELGTADTLGIVWNATADATDILRHRLTVPWDYCESQDMFKVIVRARKTGAGTDNADLALDAALKTLTADAAEMTSIAADAVTLAAKTAATTLASFQTIEFDFSNNDLKAGSIAEINLFPNEAIGTNLALEVLDVCIHYRAHAGLTDRSLRNL